MPLMRCFMTPEQSLWRGVIDQSLADWWLRLQRGHAEPEDVYCEAHRYFTSWDGQFVLTLAGYDPDAADDFAKAAADLDAKKRRRTDKRERWMET